jgi:hypothetical protein
MVKPAAASVDSIAHGVRVARGPGAGKHGRMGRMRVGQQRPQQLRHALVGEARHQVGPEPAHAVHLPDQVDDVADEHLLDHVGGLQRRGDPREQFVVAGRALAGDERRRPRQGGGRLVKGGCRDRKVGYLRR